MKIKLRDEVREYPEGISLKEIALSISEGLARMVFITPELDESYFDIVTDTAREMLARMKGGAN